MDKRELGRDKTGCFSGGELSKVTSKSEIWKILRKDFAVQWTNNDW